MSTPEEERERRMHAMDAQLDENTRLLEHVLALVKARGEQLERIECLLRWEQR